MILRRSTADSSLFNNVVTGLNVVLIVFVLAAGFPNVQAENYTPFAPFGSRGIFTGERGRAGVVGRGPERPARQGGLRPITTQFA